MKRLSIYLIFIILLGTGAFAQDGADSTSEDQADDPTESTYQKWEDSIRYGIDSSVSTTIDEMIEQKDDHFADEVLNLLSSSRQSLRTKALDYFEALELNTAIDDVIGELEFYQDVSSQFLSRLIQHLQRREYEINRRLWDLLREIIEEEGRDVRIAAINYIAQAEYEPAAQYLAERYEDADTEDSEREYILRALGSLKNEETEELIFELALDDTIDNTQRIAAIQAAGKYGNDQALNVMREALSSTEILIRTTAIAALSDFPIDDVEDLYLDALRDSFWRIRLTALRGIADNPFSDAFPAIRYMSTQDPENNIKEQAYRSIAALDVSDGWSYLREALSDTELGLQFRRIIAALLIDENFSPSKSVIEEVMVEQWEEENSQLLDTICRELSTREISNADDLFGRMLGHENFIIQIYGVRGIGRNKILRFRSDLENILESEDSHPALKSNTQTALDQL